MTRPAEGTAETVDRDRLAAFYVQAMEGRMAELRNLRSGLEAGDAGSFDAARRVAQALRGSGGTFGFPELSAVAATVETAADADTLRRVEGLLEYLRGLGPGKGTSRVWAEWLAHAARIEPSDGFPDLSSAWRWVAARASLDERALAGRVAERLGLRLADLAAPARSALRLVPEALMRAESILPLAEDAGTVTVATSNPTCLATELELTRLTGRRPVFVVASPLDLGGAIDVALDRTFDEAIARRSAPASPDEGRPAKVLIVDDDADSRLLAKAVLEKRGYHVVEAGDGRVALERLREDSAISLVVADLNMPEIDGLELIWAMRGDPAWRHIPVIVLTAETDELLETRLIEEGADDYLAKPLDARLFAARVGATIRRARQ